MGAGSELVKRSIEEMKRNSADEVVLEAETTNYGALALYQNLGFIRDKRLHRCAHADMHHFPTACSSLQGERRVHRRMRMQRGAKDRTIEEDEGEKGGGGVWGVSSCFYLSATSIGRVMMFCYWSSSCDTDALMIQESSKSACTSFLSDNLGCTLSSCR